MADRIDWPSILQKLGSPAAAGEPSLFVFSEGARLLLLALAERLTWRATYRVDGYDYADWDMVQQFGEEALFILAGGLKMEEITNRLDVIINLLREQPLCCADGPIPPNPPNITKNTPNGVPQGVIENGWAVDNNDWAGYNDYLCEAATALVRSLKSTLVQLQTFVERGSLSTAVLLALVAGAFAIGGLVFPMALAVAGSIVSIVVSTADIVDLWGTAIDEITTYETEFVCAIIGTTDSDNAVNGFSGIIDVRVSSPVMRTIIYRIPFERGIRAIMAGEYNGEYIALTESTGANCDCAPPAPALSPLVVNADATYSPDYRQGSAASQTAVLTAEALVNDGMELWSGGVNQSAWWGTLDAVRVYNNNAVGITVTPTANSRVKFRHSRTSNFGGAANFIIRSTADNTVLHQTGYDTARIVPAVVENGYVLTAGTSYRLVFSSTATQNWYFGGFELIAA